MNLRTVAADEYNDRTQQQEYSYKIDSLFMDKYFENGIGHVERKESSWGVWIRFLQNQEGNKAHSKPAIRRA